jgi:actin-related protein
VLIFFKFLEGKNDTELIEYLIKDIFENQLKCESSNEEIFIIDNASHSKEYRNKLAEIFFDKFKVSSINFMNSSILGLLSSGRTE